MILFFSGLTFTLNSQTFFFEKYGVEQGLGSSKVYSILQDSHDYIWLGTESGVSRFDGSQFENFGITDGLAVGAVFSLFEDSAGRIWFGHLNGGLSLYDSKGFHIVKFDSITVTGDITSIRKLGSSYWFTTSANGAIRTPIPGANDTILKGEHYAGEKGLSDQVFSSYIDNSETFFCIADAGIKRYDPDKDMFETYSPEGLTKYFSVITMFQDSKGNYWYGLHNGGLYKQDARTGEMKIYDIRDGLSRMYISYITEDYKGDIWVGTWGGGITIFSGDKIKVYNKKNGLSALNIHFILQDKENNMLIADHIEGLSIYKGDQFVTYNTEAFLPDNNVWAISQDETGKFWFGTNAGISVYDPDISGKDKVTIYDEQNNAIGNSIRFIEPDNDGGMWIGTYGSGVYRYNLKTGKFIFNTRLNRSLYNDRIVTAMVTDKKNNLWIGTNAGVVYWDPERSEASFYSQQNGLAGNLITSLFCDSKGYIWIGSEMRAGLTKHIPGSEKFTIIDIGEGIIPKTMGETPDGTLWIGTVAGLIALRGDTVAFTLTQQDGLLSDNIKSIQPYGDSSLYIGSNLGLNRYNLNDGTVSSFTRNSGFIGIEAHYNASYQDKNGKLWFGTANGLTMLDPEKIPVVRNLPVTWISKMEVNYMPRQFRQGMKLTYKEKSLIFYYYSVSLIDQKAVKYRVMLKGADPGWRPITDQTMATYSGLSPGHYTFMVKAQNSSGYWNDKPVEYSFIIKPPFYFSPWFLTIVILVLFFAIISYIKIRERNLVKEKKILEAKVAERTAEVVQKSEIIEQKNRDITASIRYAERIQRAMLPHEEAYDNIFVLYLPKDIVSGDFYWMYDTGDCLFLAAVDCTGHGVPGAFMSIIGHNSLNKVVGEYGIKKPSAILDHLNTEINKAILQSQEKGINDGMDLTLIMFDRKKFRLELAGAFNPLYQVRDGEVIVHKTDRFPIGMTTLEQQKRFTNIKVDIKPGDMLYMCSDGYADQFGSPDVKKFKTVNIKKLLAEIWTLPVNEQKQRLEKEIMEWKGELQQIDDIMFMGMKIPG
jgi:ligand-binding sensor domain-containing protein/serine phosphatase RsbU (regulator of sigma subunit)